MTKGFTKVIHFYNNNNPPFSCTKKKEDDAGLPGPNVGSPAPLFTLKDINGKEVSLNDFKGKVVLINFLGNMVQALSGGDG